MSAEKIAKVSKISKKALQQQQLKMDEQINEKKFEAAAKTEETKAVQTQKLDEATKAHNAEMARRPTLMDEVRDLNKKVEAVSKTDTDKLVAESKKVITRIEQLKKKLQSPNLELKDSVQNILKNKLSHIDDNLKVALNKAGIEYKSPEVATKGLVNPIERFLGLLTHGQSQLESLSTDVNAMHANRKELSPASMLMIQIKVGRIQHELEFFTSILNKALESTKTIMNVQV